MTLNSFKKQLGVEKLEFMKSERTGQQFVTVGTEKVFISKKADLKKPLFVICNDGKMVPELKGTWWITNDGTISFPSRVDYRAQMLDLPAATLVEAFQRLYKFEYGHKKLSDTISSVRDDATIKSALRSIVVNRKLIDANTILSIMNTKRYFIFSKAETLCVGAMEAVMKWYESFLEIANSVKYLDPQNSETVEKIDRMLTHFIVDVVFACGKLKTGIGRNFFDKYYVLITSIYFSDFVKETRTYI
jgi:hypothetical protein